MPAKHIYVVVFTDPYNFNARVSLVSDGSCFKHVQMIYGSPT